MKKHREKKDTTITARESLTRETLYRFSFIEATENHYAIYPTLSRSRSHFKGGKKSISHEFARIKFSRAKNIRHDHFISVFEPLKSKVG